MRVREFHPWKLTPAQAQEAQRWLAPQVLRHNGVGEVRWVAGADVSPGGKGWGRGAVVVLSYPSLEVAEVSLAQEETPFPYIPGLLAFRELPPLLKACAGLSTAPDLFLVDGQGLAHPRRLGIACHLGLLIDVPAIGCAKSRLIGQHSVVGEVEGSWAELVDRGEVVGATLRTREGTEPVYISIGHKVDLPSAITWVLACCRGHRLPEPLRLAHLAATGRLGELKPQPASQGRLF